MIPLIVISLQCDIPFQRETIANNNYYLYTVNFLPLHLTSPTDKKYCKMLLLFTINFMELLHI